MSQKKKLERIFAGKSYILCTYYFPPEIANALDVEVLYIERVVGICVSGHCIADTACHCCIKEAKGCSYQSVLFHLIEQKILPKPVMTVAVEFPCRDAVSLCEKLHSTYAIPIIYIHKKHLGAELKCFFEMAQEKFGCKKSLEETTTLSNQATEIKRKIDCLRIQYPGIVASDDCLKIFTVENDFGNMTAIYVLRNLLDFILDSIPKYHPPEGSMIFWMGLIPLYNNNILLKTERQTGCKFIYEEMWMFREKNIESGDVFNALAGNITNGVFYNRQTRADAIIRKIQAFNVEAVINFYQKNCSFLPAQDAFIRERMKKHNIRYYTTGQDVIAGNYKEQTLVNITRGICRSDDTNTQI